jgi:glycosyltransferase involved in cell wall biosynthesis
VIVDADPGELEHALPPILIVTAGGLEHGGGIGRMVGYLSDAWRADPAAPAFEILDPRGPGPWRRWPARFSASLRRIWRRRHERPLIYIHVAGRGSSLRKFLVTGFCRLSGLPVLLHLHDYDFATFYRSLPMPLGAGVRWMFRTADHVVVLGREARATVTELLGVPEDRVSILPNAVPAPPRAGTAQTDGPNAGTAQTDGPNAGTVRGDGPVKILFLGQLSRRKGVHDLIEALDRPALRALFWTATLAGGGPHQASFEQLLAGTGVADRVALPGWVDRPSSAALLAAADILVLPSYAEGLAMSVLEGMAQGLCVVCTPVGALGEVIEHERSGLLVAPGAVDELAAALARAVSDLDLRRRLGAGALATFHSGYDAATYPARLLPIMRLALRRRIALPDRKALAAEP